MKLSNDCAWLNDLKRYNTAKARLDAARDAKKALDRRLPPADELRAIITEKIDKWVAANETTNMGTLNTIVRDMADRGVAAFDERRFLSMALRPEAAAIDALIDVAISYSGKPVSKMDRTRVEREYAEAAADFSSIQDIPYAAEEFVHSWKRKQSHYSAPCGPDGYKLLKEQKEAFDFFEIGKFVNKSSTALLPVDLNAPPMPATATPKVRRLSPWDKFREAFK